MAASASDISIYLKPALCANQHDTSGSVAQCTIDGNSACGGCQLVQYCSKECQKADWPRHKATCKSTLIKSSWKPGWHQESRNPAFVGYGPPLVQFGTKKYLWGNMPALDILKLKDDERHVDKKHDFSLLFAASGDPRNVFKTIVGIPADHKGKCDVIINDMEFDIVARNTIMLLVALQYDAEVAVPMIIHIWYSALLPSAMVRALQSDILPMIKDVCDKTKNKARDSLQAKTFNIRSRTLRLVLKKEEWTRLMTYFHVPEGLSAKKAQTIRREITLAPSRVDYRERAMLLWPPALRQGEMYFRESGVLLPYGCSTAAFDTPNPTFFQTYDWPMMDNASPRDGWAHAEYHKHCLAAKADHFGAVFMHLRDLLMKFCERLENFKVSFELICVNATDMASRVGVRRFDRIEISNICDRGYVGPYSSLRVFSSLLKDRKASPKATLLMLFLNAVKETDHLSSDLTKSARMHLAIMRTKKYLPLDSYWIGVESYGDIDLTRRTSSLDLLTNWQSVFDTFVKETQLSEAAQTYGLRVKNKHTIVEPWPYTLGSRATQKEFDILAAASTSGFERYVEFERL